MSLPGKALFKSLVWREGQRWLELGLTLADIFNHEAQLLMSKAERQALSLCALAESNTGLALAFGLSPRVLAKFI